MSADQTQNKIIEKTINAETFEEVADMALSNFLNSHNYGMVCGPLTTGGTGYLSLNIKVFDAVIKGLTTQGKILFNQVPYESCLHRLSQKWQESGNTGYCLPILHVFYARIFESGHITEAWFIPGWESSFGARYEREKLLSEGCIVHDLTRTDMKEFLQNTFSPERADEVLNLFRESQEI